MEATCDDEANDDPFANYINFYFINDEGKPQEFINRAQFGAIMLHNSWTPEVYKNTRMSNV